MQLQTVVCLFQIALCTNRWIAQSVIDRHILTINNGKVHACMRCVQLSANDSLLRMHVSSKMAANDVICNPSITSFLLRIPRFQTNILHALYRQTVWVTSSAVSTRKDIKLGLKTGVHSRYLTRCLRSGYWPSFIECYWGLLRKLHDLE